MKLHRKLFGLFLLLGLAVFAIACTPSATTNPTETPSAGTQSIQTPEPTLEPTVIPTPTPRVQVRLVLLDPKSQTAQYADSLPVSEVECAIREVTETKLLHLLAGNPELANLEEDEQQAFIKCFSTVTAQTMFISEIARASSNISSDTLDCLIANTGNLSVEAVYVDLLSSKFYNSFLSGLFCLSPDERARFEASDHRLNLAEIGGIDAVECMVNSTSQADLASLVSFLGQPSPSFSEVGEYLHIFVGCGLLDDEDFEDTGLTASQLVCIVKSVGAEQFALIMDGWEPDSDAEAARILTKLLACGASIDELLGDENGSDPGDHFGPQGSSPAEGDSDIPFTPAEIRCITGEMSADELADALVGGPPTAQMLRALAACNIDVTELLGRVADGSGTTIPGTPTPSSTPTPAAPIRLSFEEILQLVLTQTEIDCLYQNLTAVDFQVLEDLMLGQDDNSSADGSGLDLGLLTCGIDFGNIDPASIVITDIRPG